MANWGPGIYQNDVGEDIKSTFLDTCKRGKTVEEATEYFIQEYAAEIQDEDDAPDFWLALADVQWKIGHLQQVVKEKALECIELELQNGGKEYFDASENKKRKEVIKKLQEQLISLMPKAKKITPYKFYKCEWRMGDVYAYPLDGEIFKNTKAYGRYILLYKVGEMSCWPGHIIPVVKIKMTESNEIPRNIEGINALKYVPMGRGENPNKRVYMEGLYTTSKRIIPNKVLYVGNYILEKPIDEEELIIDESLHAMAWKFVDEIILNKIKYYKLLE